MRKPPKKKENPLVVPSNEIRKHIAAVHIGGNLSFLERKLINILLLNAFDGLMKGQGMHRIPLPFLLTMIGWSDSHNVTQLKEALSNLVSTKIVFDLLYDPVKNESDKKRTRWATTAWLAGAEIFEGVCEYQYSAVLQKALASREMFAIFNVGSQTDFNSMYGLTLYENCARFKGTGSTGWISIALWRDLLGVTRYDPVSNERLPTVYSEFKHFNSQILKPAIDEVNTLSNIKIECETKRQGRKVEFMRFLVTEDPQGKLLGAESEHAARNSDVFRQMIEIGIAEKAALHMATTDPDRALLACQLTNEREAQNGIKKSKAGYFVSLFDSGNDLKPVAVHEPYFIERVLPVNQAEEVEKDKRAGARNSADADLTDDERNMLRDQFIAMTPGAKAGAAVGRVAAPHSFAFKTFVLENRKDIIASRIES